MSTPFARIGHGTLAALGDGVADLVLDGRPVRVTVTAAQAAALRALEGVDLRCVVVGTGEGIPRLVSASDAATWRPPTPEERLAAILGRWGEVLRALGPL